ncbi:hypothetical protein H0H87_000657, partial [Tephrocybe sp. NHM501043]
RVPHSRASTSSPTLSLSPTSYMTHGIHVQCSIYLTSTLYTYLPLNERSPSILLNRTSVPVRAKNTSSSATSGLPLPPSSSPPPHETTHETAPVPSLTIAILGTSIARCVSLPALSGSVVWMTENSGRERGWYCQLTRQAS